LSQFGGFGLEKSLEHLFDGLADGSVQELMDLVFIELDERAILSTSHRSNLLENKSANSFSGD